MRGREIMATGALEEQSMTGQGAELAAARRRFLDGIETVRARLHRYCTRLLSSPLDAEDVVQEVLAQAFFKGPILARQEGLENWLFRVAHNRAMDMLRRRMVRQRPLEGQEESASAIDPVAALQSAEAAFGHLVGSLPPKERASLVLKDVLDYSLEETATTLESTVGAVKAALHRARTKLQAAGTGPLSLPLALDRRPSDPEHLRLVSAYANRFNARDWDGLVSLLKADANLQVLEVFDASGRAGFEQRYFRNYSSIQVQWSARAAVLAGEPILVVEREVEGERRLYSLVRVRFDGGKIASVTDYLHVPPYLLEAAAEAVGSGRPAGFEWSQLGLPGPPGLG